MSEDDIGQKRRKTDKDIPTADGQHHEVSIKACVEASDFITGANGTLDLDTPESMEMNRKASALLNLSGASAFEANDPVVREWMDYTRDQIYKHCAKKYNGKLPDKPSDETQQRKYHLACQSWVVMEFSVVFSQDHLQMYHEFEDHDLGSIRSEKAVTERRSFVELVLLCGLERSHNHPFNKEAVRTLLRTREIQPHEDIRADDFGLATERVLAAIEEFKKANYWSGVRILYPNLKRSGNARTEEWWEDARLELEEGWTGHPFLGNEVISAVFARMMRTPVKATLYARVLHLIQAPGSGKSRLLKELLNHIPGIYINPSDSPHIVPSRDNVLVDWLNSKAYHDGMQTTKYLCLLDALFLESFEVIEDLIDESRYTQEKLTEEDLAKKLQSQLDSSGDRDMSCFTFFPAMTATRGRASFMRRVKARAEDRYKKLEEEKHWNDEALQGPYRRELHDTIMKHFIKPWELKLQSLRGNKLNPSKDVRVVLGKGERLPATFLFCIDDLAQTELSYDKKKITVDESPRHHLERAASLFQSLDVWFCTASSFPHWDREQDRYQASDRKSPGSYLLPKPFCAMPLNIEALRQINSPDPDSQKRLLKKPMMEFSDLTHLTLYGKPIWRVYRHLEEQDFNLCLFTKLVRNYDSGKADLGYWKIDLNDPCHVLSVLSVRACLNPIIGSNTPMERLRDMVVKHLCPVKHLDPASGVLQLDQYMDPPLAHAVTHFFTRERSNWSDLIHALTTNDNKLPVQNLKEDRERSELFIRFICLISRDRAWKLHKRPADDSDSESGVPVQVNLKDSSRTSKPILLLLFLKALFPANMDSIGNYWDQLQFITKSDETGSKFRTPTEVFNQAYINFTHFQAADQPLNPKTLPALLHNLLRQNAALICKRGQPKWDLLIPYYNGDPEQAFNRENVSAIAIQIKNRDGFENIDDDTLTDEQKLEDWHSPGYECFANLKVNNSPLITILCDLGREAAPGSPHVKMDTRSNILHLQLTGSTKDTYGCLENDAPLQDALRTLLDSCQSFVGSSVYESRILAGNRMFENS